MDEIDVDQCHALTPYWIEVRKVKNRGRGGRGVFAVTDIAKDSMIEICPVIKVPRDEIFKDDGKTELSAYAFNFGEYKSNSKYAAVALGYGSLYNHSNNPNADFEYDYDGDRILFYTLRDIKANEEIMVDYGMEEMDFVPNE